MSCTAKIGDNIITLNESGPSGDESFSRYDENDDWIEYDYDSIGLEDFNLIAIFKYQRIQELGGDVSFGAGRDG